MTSSLTRHGQQQRDEAQLLADYRAASTSNQRLLRRLLRAFGDDGRAEAPQAVRARPRRRTRR